MQRMTLKDCTAEVYVTVIDDLEDWVTLKDTVAVTQRPRGLMLV